MKKFFLKLILFIIMISLIGLIGIIGFAIYTDLTSEDIIEKSHTLDDMVAVENANNIETESTTSKISKGISDLITDVFNSNHEEKDNSKYSEKNSNGNFFYEQLNDTQKKLYNGLQENKDNIISGTYVIEFGNTFSELLSQDGGVKQLKEDYQTAIEAYTHDNPDLFYLSLGKMYLNIETSRKAWKTSYNVYIGPASGKNYYNDNFSSKEQVKLAISQIEQKRDYILNHMTDNTYKNIRFIHNYLVDNIEYDKNYNSIGTYSIYGALIEKKCVCEGYARAFKDLANAAGIKCELVQGTATNSSGQTEAHAWNCVFLENKWYYVDCTWDDPVIIGNGIITSREKYRYFLKGSRTLNKDHVTESRFSDGGKIFNYPNINEYDY